MNYWIVPSNNSYYRLDDRLSKYEIISWRQRQDFEVGDVIFIYTTSPASRITYQMSVIGANQSFSAYNNDKEYWVDQEEFAKKVINFKRFAEFKLVRRFPSDARLTYDNLKAHGLRTIQMAHRIKGGLLDYVLSSISDIDAGNLFPIHVHHTTPISSIGKDYQIDYNKDLVPVCPNCHAMLHRKNPPYTIEELLNIMKKSTI